MPLAGIRCRHLDPVLCSRDRLDRAAVSWALRAAGIPRHSHSGARDGQRQRGTRVARARCAARMDANRSEARSSAVVASVPDCPRTLDRSSETRPARSSLMARNPLDLGLASSGPIARSRIRVDPWVPCMPCSHRTSAWRRQPGDGRDSGQYIFVITIEHVAMSRITRNVMKSIIRHCPHRASNRSLTFRRSRESPVESRPERWRARRW